MQKSFGGESDSSKYAICGFNGIAKLADEFQERAPLRAGFIVKATLTLLSDQGVEVIAGANVNWHCLLD